MYKQFFCLWITVCGLVASQCSHAQSTDKPATISFAYSDLLEIRKNIKKSNYHVAYKNLLAVADKILAKTPAKVTDGDMPPTGDRHDFYTIGKFSWPNPNTPDGMPYIRGDGKYNQEAFGDRYDLTRFQQTVNDINMLTLAWFYSQNEKYAAKASELLKIWFVDPATRMNPNMNCASALPGVYNGMAAGIIFTVFLIEMTDHVQMLRLSQSWDKASDEALKTWFNAYKDWLRTSTFGIEEKAAKNNHGTWYAAQVLAYSLLTGKQDSTATAFEQAKQKVQIQITPGGELPLEMKRVEGFHYFIYGLKAFNVLANGFEQYGYNLWSYKTPDGKSIELPYRFILPYVTGEKSWTTGGVQKVHPGELIRMIKQADARYQLADSKKAIEVLTKQMKDTDIDRLYILL